LTFLDAPFGNRAAFSASVLVLAVGLVCFVQIFSRAGMFEFACLIPGYFEAGMMCRTDL